MKPKTRTTIVVTATIVGWGIFIVAQIIALGAPFRPDPAHGLICPMPSGRVFTHYGTVHRCIWYWIFAGPLFLIVLGGFAAAFVMYGIFKFRQWRG